jgi:hypothetical protein
VTFSEGVTLDKFRHERKDLERFQRRPYASIAPSKSSETCILYENGRSWVLVRRSATAIDPHSRSSADKERVGRCNCFCCLVIRCEASVVQDMLGFWVLIVNAGHSTCLIAVCVETGHDGQEPRAEVALKSGSVSERDWREMLLEAAGAHDADVDDVAG